MAIELSGVRYRYAGAAKPALTSIDLRLEPGRVLGVVGANESGKTTLCLVAGGFAPGVVGGRLEGSARIDGVETRSIPTHALALHCGLLFQNAATQLSNTTATVFEEVGFGPCNLGLAVPDVIERIWWALRAVGIEDLAPRDPARLSGGQGQLVALASVLALRPRYLILDEPTSELDPAGTALVVGALARVAEETGAGILLVEHKTDVLARIADEVVVLGDGSVSFAGPAAAVLADPVLAQLGVEPPAPVALERDVRAAGLDWPVELGGSARPGSAQAGLSDSSSVAPSAMSSSEPSAPSSSDPSATPSIELERVSFSYPDGTRALENVGLRIGPGELVAIVGQNGAGKSTLVRHLNGLLRPTAGRVLLDGRDIRSMHVARLAGRVGLAFQNPDRQLFAGRVSSEVAFGPSNLGLRGAGLDERVRAALDAVGLRPEADSNPYDLGYSRRKLLSLASVLAMRTPILVLDEPTTGQDARGAARVRAVVAAAAEQGRTVIAVSHDMRFVAECFRRVVVMRAGQVVLDGTPDVAFGEASWRELRAAYLEPPFAAVAGARLGLGATPTTSSFVAALARRAG